MIFSENKGIWNVSVETAFRYIDFQVFCYYTLSE